MFRLALTSARFVKTPMVNSLRFYAAEPITKQQVTERALTALKTVTAIQESKLTLTSSFKQDLGLDSLDTVEALVALEEEFDLEFPDKVSDGINNVQEAVDYIYEQEKNL